MLQIHLRKTKDNIQVLLSLRTSS